MMYLTVQIIQIQYTDDQRGSADAEKRQRIRAMPFVPVAGDGVLHECRVNAWESFEPKTATSPLLLRNGEVLVADSMKLRVDDSALVFIQDAGAEVWKSEPILKVPQGRWARLVWNAKRSSHESKWLVEFVMNAGVFSNPPEGNVFLGSPAAEQDLRRDFLRNAYS